ncbi:MAG: glycosyltransferase family 4 protein [Acidobacteria bacterium]|nr:glycosyltransferase family 4 protein [Acidobacteriota bacterium]
MSDPALHVLVPGPLEQRTGGYIYDARIVDGLRRRGWRVAVHELDGRFPEGDPAARAGLRAALAGLPDGARVVIDGLAMGGLPALVQAAAARLRIVGLAHLLLADETGLTDRRRADYTASEREALAACAGVVATSGHTAARVRARGVDAAAVRVVPPGTDPAPPAPGPGPGAPPRIFCAATVTPRKGQDVLVRALAQVADLEWSCVCAGSLTRAPAFASEVRRLAEDAGLDARIGFPGECGAAEMEAFYDASSLFVLPSHFEGYGMVLTEALARGLPVVSTTGGAIPQTVPPGTGMLAPPGDAGALAAALRTLLAPGAGAGERARLAAAARRYAAGLPDWEATAEAFGAAVLALTATPAAGRTGRDR